MDKFKDVWHRCNSCNKLIDLKKDSYVISDKIECWDCHMKRLNEWIIGGRMSKVTREEMNKEINNLEKKIDDRIDAWRDNLKSECRMLLSNIGSLEKRIDQLEKSDFATATQISTLLDRAERLKEPSKEEAPLRFFSVFAKCEKCGHTCHHIKKGESFACLTCDFRWY